MICEKAEGEGEVVQSGLGKPWINENQLTWRYFRV